MIPWSLIRANLFRHPTRTTLTFASLVVAFTLFILLRAIADAFSGGVSLEGTDRLIVDAKYSMTDNLPIAYLPQIRALEGVDEAVNVSWFGGFYRDPKETFTTYSTDPLSFFDIFEEYAIEPEALERFATTRIGAVASQPLFEKYGWSVGDRVTLQGDIWPQEDGSWFWEFELVGMFTEARGRTPQPLFLLRHDYFDDAVAGWAKDQVGFIVVRVDESSRPEDVAAAIDGPFANSSDPTRTASEDQYTRQFASQLGDIGLISTMILGAVFFTILLLTGNTAAQTFRERVPELAVMKTLGFTDASVAVLVLTEAVALCLAGGITGVTLALLLEPVLNASLGGVLGAFETSLQSVLIGVGLSLALGLVIGAQPAWAARRLPIVDALREH